MNKSETSSKAFETSSKAAVSLPRLFLKRLTRFDSFGQPGIREFNRNVFFKTLDVLTDAGTVMLSIEFCSDLLSSMNVPPQNMIGT